MNYRTSLYLTIYFTIKITFTSCYIFNTRRTYFSINNNIIKCNDTSNKNVTLPWYKSPSLSLSEEMVSFLFI
jgi:hypothetical protein